MWTVGTVPGVHDITTRRRRIVLDLIRFASVIGNSVGDDFDTFVVFAVDKPATAFLNCTTNIETCDFYPWSTLLKKHFIIFLLTDEFSKASTK